MEGKRKIYRKEHWRSKEFFTSALLSEIKSIICGRIVIHTTKSDKIARYQKKRSDGTKDFNFDKHLCKKEQEKKEREREKERKKNERTKERVEIIVKRCSAIV